MPSDNPNRKTKFSLHFVENKGVLVSLFSQQANAIVYDAIVDGKIFFPLVISVLKRIGTKVITMHDLDDEGNPSHVYLNNTIGELSDKVITFKPNIETFLGITKEMCNDKYMGSIILINEFYLDDNEKLNELLEKINNTIEIVVKN